MPADGKEGGVAPVVLVGRAWLADDASRRSSCPGGSDRLFGRRRLDRGG